MLKIGVWLPSDFQDPGDYLADARALEAAEADSLWVGPGLQVDQPESRLGLEVFPLLGAIAGVTYRVRLAIWIGSLHALSHDTLSPVIDSLQRLSRGRMLVATAGSAEQQLDERIIKNVKQSLERTLCSLCPYCEGAGYVKSEQTVVGEILQEAHKMAGAVDRREVTLRVNPEVAKLLKSSRNDYLQELEEILGRTVLVKSDPLIHQDKFDLA